MTKFFLGFVWSIFTLRKCCWMHCVRDQQNNTFLFETSELWSSLFVFHRTHTTLTLYSLEGPVWLVGGGLEWPEANTTSSFWYVTDQGRWHFLERSSRWDVEVAFLSKYVHMILWLVSEHFHTTISKYVFGLWQVLHFCICINMPVCYI